MAPLQLQRPRLTAVLLGTAFFAVGCFTPDELRDRADRDALALVDQRREQLFGDQGPFALPAATAAFGRGERDPSTWTAREKVLAGMLDQIGPLDVVGALEIASEDSQEVQEERESLYLSALALTQDRWTFGYRYQADGGGSIGGDLGGSSASAGADFGASVTRILGSGAVVLANIGADLFRFVSTGDGWDAVSNLGLSVTQPILRGTGRLVTLEPLRQSERDLIYSVRSYERFRRTYAVDVSEQVYRVLQSRDQLNNERLNLENLERLRIRNEALSEAGQLSEIQADQARQNLLDSKNRLVQLQGSVERQLDFFKVFLGLPVEGAEVLLADGILKDLASDNSFLDGLGEELAVDFALDHRLDVMTSFDRVQDATRREAIARDGLRAGLGLSASANSTSPDGRPLSNRTEDVRWTLGLDVDLPVDLLPARNAWRRSEIALVNTKRDYERFLDNVTLSVRDALRRARNSYESYEIQRNAVTLSKRRVRGAELSQEAGTASTRDVLESQEALRQARNSATSARIAFTLALLDLWLEMEILRVDESGVHLDEDLNEALKALRSE